MKDHIQTCKESAEGVRLLHPHLRRLENSNTQTSHVGCFAWSFSRHRVWQRTTKGNLMSVRLYYLFIYIRHIRKLCQFQGELVGRFLSRIF